MNKRIELGRLGEKVAEKYLVKKGFEILEKNYRNRMGEIDLICREEKTIVFVEVKTRKSTDFGLPIEAVDYRKRNKLTQVAKYYIKQLEREKETKKEDNLEKFDYRFDVVGVFFSPRGEKNSIELIRNAF